MPIAPNHSIVGQCARIVGQSRGSVRTTNGARIIAAKSHLKKVRAIGGTSSCSALPRIQLHDQKKVVSVSSR